jgi:para-aminobenzoate synthetase / 4-amino-4-deoxychorismate lyase
MKNKTIQDLEKLDHFLLFDSFGNKDSNLNSQILFSNPLDILSTENYKDLPSIFNRIKQYTDKEYYVAGYLSYEAGNEFRKKKKTNLLSSAELCKFGVYKNFEEVSLFPIHSIEIESFDSLFISEFKTNISKDEYIEAIHIIKNAISSGELYQVNFTFQLSFNLQIDTTHFYNKLKRLFKTPYSALLRFSKDDEYLSFSPELFFEKNDLRITVRPMKGTSIKTEKSKLLNAKNKAENFMIVDLLRNDLGQISKVGSVSVNELLHEEEYGNILQLTSEISSELKNHISDYSLFNAMFPSGSITGAPKENAIDYIETLEKSPRGIYTGAIGYFFPNGKSMFNVSIRTLKKTGSQFRMGVGSGIVFDSDPELEWEECHQKAFFLYRAFQFFIFESILFKNGIFYFLEEHIERLKRSSLFLFGHFDEVNIRKKLQILPPKPQLNFKLKVIYLESREINLEWSEVKKKQFQYKIKISEKIVHSNELFLYHKTSIRSMYDEEYHKNKEFFDDIIFTNEKGEITEGCISNIFIFSEGIYFTPPITSGILKGIFRSKLLGKFPKIFKEKIITKKMLLESNKIFICNSVRGVVKVKLYENKN